MLYHVDADQVASAAGRASATGQAIRGEVAAMLAELESLQGSWQGAAAHAFADLLAQWRSAQVQLETALDAISSALAHAAAEYDTAESSAARLFAR